MKRAFAMLSMLPMLLIAADKKPDWEGVMEGCKEAALPAARRSLLLRLRPSFIRVDDFSQ